MVSQRQNVYSAEFEHITDWIIWLFFALMGLQVKLEKFLQKEVIFLAGGLLIAAIIGKVVSGLGAFGAKNRMAVGIEMMPRGEVGLIFAAIGKSLGVLDDIFFLRWY